jgi:hypothetical protein
VSVPVSQSQSKPVSRRRGNTKTEGPPVAGRPFDFPIADGPSQTEGPYVQAVAVHLVSAPDRRC